MASILCYESFTVKTNFYIKLVDTDGEVKTQTQPGRQPTFLTALFDTLKGIISSFLFLESL